MARGAPGTAHTLQLTTATLHNTHSSSFENAQWRKQHEPGTLHTAQTMHTAHCVAHIISYMILGQLGLRQVGQLNTLKNSDNHLYQFFRTVQDPRSRKNRYQNVSHRATVPIGWSVRWCCGPRCKSKLGRKRPKVLTSNHRFLTL